MAESNLNIKVICDSKKVTNQLDRCTKSAERLSAELEKLANMEIGINVVEVKKRWYQFWK